jgi:hypothetical protein
MGSIFEPMMIRIPAYMRPGLLRYIEHGIEPGDFLTAILSNDLFGAFAAVERDGHRRVRDYLQFLYNDAPAGCWGSAERFEAWIKKGGLNGKPQAEDE